MWKSFRAIRDSFAPLRERNLRTYLGGQAVSLLGTWMQITAQAWVVWELTHSTVALGTVAMLNQLPYLVLGPWAGVWADRLDRRRLLIVTQTLAMCGAFVFAALVQTNAIALWHIYALALVLGCSASLDMPAQQAFIGDLAGVGNLPKAIILNAMGFHISRMLGPALAGWVIASIGTAPAFWANGASFLAVIGSLFVVRAQQVRKVSSGSAVREFAEGVRYVWRESRLFDMLAFTVLITLFAIANAQIFPAIAAEVLGGGPETLGSLMGASGLGALVASLLIVPQIQRVRRTGVALAICATWSGLGYILLSLSHWTLLSVFAVFLASIAIPPIMTTAIVVLQICSPEDMKARLLSARIMLSFGVQPFASLLVGWGAHLLGSPMMIRLNGVILIVGASALLLFRTELRVWEAGLDKPHGPGTASIVR
jgi:MFS family permease